MNRHCRHHHRPTLFLVVAVMLLPFQGARAGSGDDMDILYGRIAAAKEVDVKNHVAGSAAVGGAVGGATASRWISSNSATGNLLGGALVGGLLLGGEEYLGEQRLKGTRYSIDAVNGEDIHIITDQSGIRVGDCVAIELSDKHANLRRVSDAYCESVAAGVSDRHMDEKAKKAASDCYEAKKALLGAQGDAELEQTRRRVRALCDT